MMKHFVKPREGYTVIDPEGRRRLADDGDFVDISSSFWIKAIRDGDVTLEDAPKPPTPKLPSKPTPKTPDAAAVEDNKSNNGVVV